jgi:hypothetical protein
MMKQIPLFFLLTLTLFSATKEQVLVDYQNKNYAQACIEGSTILKAHRYDEVFINAVAFSCIESDIIDLLPTPIVLLKSSESARQNASFYSTVLFQKKMLYHALLDGIDISGIRVPKVDYVLSTVFDLYVRGEYEQKGSVYHLKDAAFTYEMQVIESNRHKKVEIKKLHNGSLVKSYYYW